MLNLATRAQAIPDLAAACPGRYDGITLWQLCDEMHGELRDRRRHVELLDHAFGEIPVPATTPAGAYRHLVRGRTEKVPVADMADRAAAVLRYLLALQAFDGRFPGFAHDIHGIKHDQQGTFLIECLHKDGG